MSSNSERVALAFSGGLDTTVCVPLLEEEYGYDEVLGITVDVGQPEDEFEEAEETAEALDLEHRVVSAKEAFADLCFDAVRANATYQGYPLGTALDRPVIAERILEVAREHDCSALAHGSTGKGNDQLRFEAVWRGSDLDVLAPVRELGLTREFEQEYAAERDLPVEGGDEGAYSIDTNLWTRSVEGSELEEPDYVPGEEIYEWTETPGKGTERLEIEFEKGVPIALDRTELDPVSLIEQLNELAGEYGVGRTDVMEDRMLGLKVRENYEHPAATVLLNAHEALENLVLTKEERSFKQQVDHQWAEMGYKGLVNAPLVAALRIVHRDDERARDRHSRHKTRRRSGTASRSRERVRRLLRRGGLVRHRDGRRHYAGRRNGCRQIPRLSGTARQRRPRPGGRARERGSRRRWRCR